MTSPTLCPLCGQRNQCAQADSATPVHDCWCFAAAIAPGALERLPADQRNRACLCPRCARNLPPAAPDATVEQGD